jgi:hypothetical protein
MENIGREPAMVHKTIHGPGYSGGKGLGASYTVGNSLDCSFFSRLLLAVELLVDFV